MKRIVTSMVLGTMIISSATMSFANAAPIEKIAVASLVQPLYASTDLNQDQMSENIDWVDLETCNFEDISFVDYMGDLLTKVSARDKDQLEEHFNAAMKYEKENKYEEADKVWDDFYKLMGKYDEDMQGVSTVIEMPSYDDYMKESKGFLKKIDTATDKKLKGLYEEAEKFEKSEKYHDAMKKWDAFFDLFDRFVDEDKLAESTIMDDGFDDEFGDYDVAEFEMPSYKDFMKDISEFLKPLSVKDQKSLELLYNKAVAIEKEGKFEEAQKDWDALFKIIDANTK